MIARTRAIGNFLGRSAVRSTVKVNQPAFQVASRSIVTLEEAKKMPKTYNSIPNDILLNMAVMGDQEAREERLIREIMSVENCTW